MPRFGNKVRSDVDRRRIMKRRKVIAEGAAVTLSDIKSCLVEDLSPLGALLTGRDLPNLGSELLLRIVGTTALARVKWSKGHARGVEFAEGGPTRVQCLALQLSSVAKRA